MCSVAHHLVPPLRVPYLVILTFVKHVIVVKCALVP
jgi:hypothetical protein